MVFCSAGVSLVLKALCLDTGNAVAQPSHGEGMNT